MQLTVWFEIENQRLIDFNDPNKHIQRSINQSNKVIFLKKKLHVPIKGWTIENQRLIENNDPNESINK